MSEAYVGQSPRATSVEYHYHYLYVKVVIGDKVRFMEEKCYLMLKERVKGRYCSWVKER